LLANYLEQEDRVQAVNDSTLAGMQRSTLSLLERLLMLTVCVRQ